MSTPGSDKPKQACPLSDNISKIYKPKQAYPLSDEMFQIKIRKEEGKRKNQLNKTKKNSLSDEEVRQRYC
jgi:hypothetical protein